MVSGEFETERRTKVVKDDGIKIKVEAVSDHRHSAREPTPRGSKRGALKARGKVPRYARDDSRAVSNILGFNFDLASFDQLHDPIGRFFGSRCGGVQDERRLPGRFIALVATGEVG